MDLQLQNWENFCKYQVGNWHGTWTRYSPELEVIESFRSIRSFLLTENGDEVYQQNHYIYSDGRSESKGFGITKKPLFISLFLDNAFSWGSTETEQSAKKEKVALVQQNQSKWRPFFFENGFRYEERRISAGSVYDEKSNLKKLFVVNEQLGSFSENIIPSTGNKINSNSAGTQKNITPDLAVSPSLETSWQPLENLGDDYFTLNTQEGVSVSCPRYIEVGKEFFLAVDWLINPDLLHRGIRYYDASGFTHFTLEIFSNNS